MKILLVDNGTILLPQLQRLIPGSEVTKKFSDIQASDADNFDLTILSGSKNQNVVFDESKFAEEIKIIRSGKPVIGICFGCELIARAFKGKLIELPEKRSGAYRIKVIDPELASDIKVHEGHRWVISELPQDFEILATSDDGPEIIHHKSMPIYGLQFHPEDTVEGPQGAELFRKLLSQF